MKNGLRKVPLIAIACLAALTNAHAETTGPWYLSATPQLYHQFYSGSVEWDSLTGYGIYLKGDYLEKAGYTLGYNHKIARFKSATPSVNQNEFFVSGRWNFSPDKIAGRVSLRLDGYLISNDDPTGSTDSVEVIAPLVSYLNYAESLYLEIGYAHSRYGDSSSLLGLEAQADRVPPGKIPMQPKKPNNLNQSNQLAVTTFVVTESLTVRQWTAGVGFSAGPKNDWVLLRAYFIDPSSLVRARGTEDTTAFEAKWTRRYEEQRPLGMDKLEVGVMLGERIFAVDPDAGVVFNLADKQAGSLFAAGQWNLNERLGSSLSVGTERYENDLIGDSYESYFVYGNLTYQW